MKRFLYLILFTVIAFSTNVAAKTSGQQILDKAATKINISKGVYADFTIAGGRSGTQSGSIAMKGNKFNVRTNSAIVWFDGKTQWLYNKKSDEVNVSSPKSSQLASMNPYYFLTLYKKGYTITSKATANGYNVHLVGKQNGIKEAYIIVDKQYNVKQIKIKQSQQWITITVKNVRNKAYNDSAFRFNAKDYPRAEVIDLR